MDENDKSFWPKVLAPEVPWTTCYPIVMGPARRAIHNHANTKSLTTTELMCLIWPEARAKGGRATSAERHRLAKALLALANHDLAAYVTRGERVYLFKRLVRPYLWRVPQPTTED